MGETISRRQGRLYYDRGETLLRSRRDFRMGETISRDTGSIDSFDRCFTDITLRYVYVVSIIPWPFPGMRLTYITFQPMTQPL